MKSTITNYLSTLSGVIGRTVRTGATRRNTAWLSLLTLAIPGLTPVGAHASWPYMWDVLPEQQLTGIAAAPGGGFWVHVDSWKWVDTLPDGGRNFLEYLRSETLPSGDPPAGTMAAHR
jgi:hypothetical protein